MAENPERAPALNRRITPCPLSGLQGASYDRARQSLVYRLSESVFASLLAAYIISFVGICAAIWLAGPKMQPVPPPGIRDHGECRTCKAQIERGRT